MSETKRYRLWCKVCHGPMTVRAKNKTLAWKKHRKSKTHQNQKRKRK